MTCFNWFKMCAVIVAIGFLGLCSRAQAVLITSTDDGIVFGDDFESGTLGALPDNGALPGVWTGDGQVTVVNDAVPGAFQGTQYLKLNRTAAAQANSFAQFSTTPVDSGIMHTEVMLYISSTSTAAAEIFISANLDFGAFPTAWVSDIIAFPSGDIFYYDNSVPGNVDTGINFTPDVWQKWELDHDIGTDTYTITVDGTSSLPLPFIDPISGAEGIRSVSFRGAGAGSLFYVDAVNVVPEPCSIILVMIGSVGLGVYGTRRKRG